MKFILNTTDSKKAIKTSWQILSLLLVCMAFVAFYLQNYWLLIAYFPLMIILLIWIFSKEVTPIEISISDNELQLNQKLRIPFDQIEKYFFIKESILATKFTVILKNKNEYSLFISNQAKNNVALNDFRKLLEETVKI